MVHAQKTADNRCTAYSIAPALCEPSMPQPTVPITNIAPEFEVNATSVSASDLDIMPRLYNVAAHDAPTGHPQSIPHTTAAADAELTPNTAPSGFARNRNVEPSVQPTRIFDAAINGNSDGITERTHMDSASAAEFMIDFERKTIIIIVAIHK